MSRMLVILVGLLTILGVGLLSFDRMEAPSSRFLFKAQAHVPSYFPSFSGLTYSYLGVGNEFATFLREIQFVEGEYLQLVDVSGTSLVRVYRITQEAVTELVRFEEFYEERSIIEEYKGKTEGTIILKAPLAVGTTWGEDPVREIVAVGEEVTVPFGTFYDVVKIEVRHLESNATTYEYYAKNMGLIKVTSTFASDYVVESALGSLSHKLSPAE